MGSREYDNGNILLSDYHIKLSNGGGTMGRYDDWYERKNDFEKEKIESNIRREDWNELNEHEKSQVYKREEVR